jgi:hypothetical protein
MLKNERICDFCNKEIKDSEVRYEVTEVANAQKKREDMCLTCHQQSNGNKNIRAMPKMF